MMLKAVARFGWIAGGIYEAWDFVFTFPLDVRVALQFVGVVARGCSNLWTKEHVGKGDVIVGGWRIGLHRGWTVDVAGIPGGR